MSARRAGFLGDSRGLSVTAIVLALVVAAALFVVSYQGLAHAAEAIGLHRAPWVVPLAIDGGILVAGLLAAVKRGQKRKATLELSILWGATFASSAANLFAHAERGDGILAVVVAASAPIFFLAITESIIRTIIQDEAPEKKPRRAKPVAAAETSAPATVPATAPVTKPRPAVRPTSPRTPIEAASPEAAALLEEFDSLASDPRSSERDTEQTARLSVVVLALVDAHNLSVSDLAARAGHDNGDRLRQRVRKARQRALVDA